MLTGNDPIAEAWNAADDITADDTGGLLAYALPDDAVVCVLGWPDVIGDALRAAATSRCSSSTRWARAPDSCAGCCTRTSTPPTSRWPDSGPRWPTPISCCSKPRRSDRPASSVSPDRAAAATAKHAGVPVWLVGGVGRLMPKRMWDALAGRLDTMGETWELDDEFVPIDLVDRIAMPMGVLDVADALTRIDCPIAPGAVQVGRPALKLDMVGAQHPPGREE